MSGLRACRRRIVARAATLAERLAVARAAAEPMAAEPVMGDPVAAARLRRWREVAADGDPVRFARRLSWEGVDAETARRALGDAPIAPGADAQPWARTLDAILRAASDRGATGGAAGGEAAETPGARRPVPFPEFYAPIQAVARRALRARAGPLLAALSDGARASLEGGLLQRLLPLCARTLDFEHAVFQSTRTSSLDELLGDPAADRAGASRDAFARSLRGRGLARLLGEYPVLARLVATSVDRWVDAAVEFLERLTADGDAIRAAFQPDGALGPVAALRPDLSDRHDGRCVMAVTFASGLALVYKPRDLGVDRALVTLLAWLNGRGTAPPLRLLTVLDRSTHGWVEFVPTMPCADGEERARYYRRCGALLCIAYVLDGTDLHNENVIGCGEHPVLIDVETLLHPVARELAERAAPCASELVADERLRHSVLRTALLPHWRSGPGRIVYDASGLAGPTRYEPLAASRPPRGDGEEPLDEPLAEHLDDLVRGFRETYRTLVAHRAALLAPDSPLAAFAARAVRYIFRPTSDYALALHRSLRPDLLRDGVDRSIELDVLSLPLLAEEQPPSWALRAVEQQALERADVPHFTARTDRDAMTVTPGRVVDGYFAGPSYAAVRSRLRALGEEDLERQVGFIRGALYAREATELHSRARPACRPGTAEWDRPATPPLTREAALRVASTIAAELRRHAIASDDGREATWIVPRYGAAAQRFALRPMRHGLYDGRGGVALFLAALERVTGGAGFRDLALAALRPLRRDLLGAAPDGELASMGLGAGSGIGSVIYALVQVGRLLDDPALVHDARLAADAITPERIAADRQLDVMGGAAGAILALLALHAACGDPSVLDRAIACGEHLLASRVVADTGDRVWARAERPPLTGLSHGSAGIALALLRLHAATARDGFAQAAGEAMRHERSVFVPEAGNWPDFRHPPVDGRHGFACAWCHGAPGIALARLGARGPASDGETAREVAREIDVALETTRAHGLDDLDHLCCGNLGRLAVLSTCGRALGRPDLQEAALDGAARVLARAETVGSFGYGPMLLHHPGFFQGAAGIGYELLRLLHGDVLPSVLDWSDAR